MSSLVTEGGESLGQHIPSEICVAAALTKGVLDVPPLKREYVQAVERDRTRMSSKRLTIVECTDVPRTDRATDIGFAYHRVEDCLDIGGLTRPRPWWINGNQPGGDEGAAVKFGVSPTRNPQKPETRQKTGQYPARIRGI